MLIKSFILINILFFFLNCVHCDTVGGGRLNGVAPAVRSSISDEQLAKNSNSQPMSEETNEKNANGASVSLKRQSSSIANCRAPFSDVLIQSIELDRGTLGAPQLFSTSIQIELALQSLGVLFDRVSG
jgi:hypothetical protein